MVLQQRTNAIGDALVSSGVNFDVSSVTIGANYLADAGVASGYFDMSKGSMLIAIIFACIIIFIIDRKWMNVAVSFLVASGCAFIGLIHAASVTVNAAPIYAITYFVFAVVFVVINLLSKNNKDLQQPIDEISEMAVLGKGK